MELSVKTETTKILGVKSKISKFQFKLESHADFYELERMLRDLYHTVMTKPMNEFPFFITHQYIEKVG